MCLDKGTCFLMVAVPFWSGIVLHHPPNVSTTPHEEGLYITPRSPSLYNLQNSKGSQTTLLYVDGIPSPPTRGSC